MSGPSQSQSSQPNTLKADLERPQTSQSAVSRSPGLESAKLPTAQSYSGSHILYITRTVYPEVLKALSGSESGAQALTKLHSWLWSNLQNHEPNFRDCWGEALLVLAQNLAFNATIHDHPHFGLVLAIRNPDLPYALLVWRDRSPPNPLRATWEHHTQFSLP